MGSSSRPPQASCHVDLTAGCTSTTAGGPVTRPLVDNRAKRFYQCGYSSSDCGLCHTFRSLGQIAQLVEQRTENPCVGSSSLPLSIKKQGWVGKPSETGTHSENSLLPEAEKKVFQRHRQPALFERSVSKRRLNSTQHQLVLQKHSRPSRPCRKYCRLCSWLLRVAVIFYRQNLQAFSGA